jgi:hypothetical protein
VIELPRRTGDTQFERSRWRVLQAMAETLSHKFDCLICGDVDELVTLSPGVALASGHSLQSYLAEKARDDQLAFLAPLGFEIIEHTTEEAALDPKTAILQQRRFGRLHSKYAKPCILFKPAALRLKPGGHIWAQGPWNLDPELILFHLKAVDRDISDAVAIARQARLDGLEQVSTGPQLHGIKGRSSPSMSAAAAALAAALRSRPAPFNLGRSGPLFCDTSPPQIFPQFPTGNS